MIYVTQGHEKSIALEIFLKSYLLLSSEERECLTLVRDTQNFEEQLKLLNFSKDLFKNLKTLETNSKAHSQTLSSVIMASEKMQEGDILLTLPTSKDQLKYQGKTLLGYTEFLREYYHNPHLAMTFKADQETLLLMTDHIPLKDVTETLTKDYIKQKLSLVLREHKKHYFSFDEVLVAGINPHAGEGGLLGSEDQNVTEALQELKAEFPQVKFVGPLSGDTLHFHKKTTVKQLLVYMYHDQGLPVFKSHHGLKGINLTLGLPFLRMSVDHGTAFDLFGKNQASPEGCLYVLKHALGLERVSYGK